MGIKALALFKKQKEVEITTKEKITMFFFGVIFVLLLGKQYFANLAGSNDAKAQLLKWYYLGLLCYSILIGILGYYYNNSF